MPDLINDPALVAAKLAAIIESSDDAIVSKTLDGTILSWNTAATRIFGYSAEEIIGKSIYQLIPQDLHAEEAGILTKIARGEHVGHYETDRIRKDGTLVPIELTVSPVRDLTGTIVGASSIKRDISERRRTFEIMARTAAIFDSSTDAIISEDLDGRVVSWNAAAERIFGYTADEMVGRSIFQLVPGHLHAEEEQILARIARGEQVEHYETVRIRKDRKEINISLTISPVRDASGEVIAAASIKRDITEQKLAELALRQITKMESIGRLAGGLAHDFNNQLHALSGFIHFIEQDQTLSSASRQDLIQIQEAVDRMASLTRQLLAFARQQVLTPETLDLDATIADMEPMLQRLIGSSIEIQLELSPGPKWVRVDRAQLVQVLLNLSINARDAMPNGGRLSLRSETLEVGPHQLKDRSGTAIEPRAYAQLLVADTGDGIPAEHLAQVFDPFFTTKDVGQGTGLGLATVEGIVSQTGGYLQIDSAPGQGTSITILLPLSHAPSREAAIGSPLREKGHGGGRILVVDDDPQVRAVITRLLRSEGYDVVEASQGEEGLKCVEQAGGGLDLVIIDVVMPVMGGRTFVKELNRRYPNIATIWISGHPRESELGDQDCAPSQPYLQKPVAADQLLDTVQATLRDRSARTTSDQVNPG
jgi:two-component system cell cycle sensor histidine kinase/response regulator CckA